MKCQILFSTENINLSSTEFAPSALSIKGKHLKGSNALLVYTLCYDIFLLMAA